MGAPPFHVILHSAKPWFPIQYESGVVLSIHPKELKFPFEPPNPKEAVKWLYLASFQGHVRAQYQLAICLYQGRGADRNMKEAEHLSCEHFGAFLANVKELNAREQRKEVKVAEATKSNAEATQSNAVVATDCDTTTDIIHEKVPNGRKCRSHRRRKSRV